MFNCFKLKITEASRKHADDQSNSVFRIPNADEPDDPVDACASAGRIPIFLKRSVGTFQKEDTLMPGGPEMGSPESSTDFIACRLFSWKALFACKLDIQK